MVCRFCSYQNIPQNYFIGIYITNTHRCSVSILLHHDVNTLDAAFQRTRFHWLLGGPTWESPNPKPKYTEVGCYTNEIALACLVSTFGQRLPSVATFGHGILLPADEKLDYPLA